MKNKVKLNIHMFLPELQESDITAEQNDALAALLALPELDQKDSVEKFTSELKSRFELIKPILGNQTEEFLGYKLEDITILANFFNCKFEKFGMDAVAVQKILRNIWLQTPSEDTRLNYGLYKFIDEKFYGIVNARKRDISFDHISPNYNYSLELLKRDWLERRAYYAECLDIDIDYLDSEAVDGTVFPSASGLFANPASTEDNTDCAVLEFLNFWMPYYQSKLIQDGRKIRIDIETILRTYIASKGKELPSSSKWISYKTFFRKQSDLASKQSKDEQDFITRVELKFFDNMATKLGVVPQDLLEQNPESFWLLSRNSICQCINEEYSELQPTHFWLKTPGEVHIVSNEKNDFSFESDEKQIPKFINSCREYLVSNGELCKSRHLEFFCQNGKIAKAYLPNEYFKDILDCYSTGFPATAFPLPELNTNNIEKQLEEYKKYCDLLYDPDGKFADKIVGWRRFSESAWYKNVSDFWRSKQVKFWNIVRKYFDEVANSDQNTTYLIQSLETIKFHFCPRNYDAFRYRDEQDGLNEHMESKIKELRGKLGLPLRTSSFCEKMSYIASADRHDKELAELKLQLCEVNTRINERNENFKAIYHDIKNMIRAIKSFMDMNDFTQANRGLQIITDIVDAVNASFRKLPNEWKEDLSSQESDKSLKDILNDAFLYGIPNMFCYGYEKIYETETLNYFEWAEDADTARLEWNKLTDSEEKFKWVSNNMFKLEWDDQADAQNIIIGNRYHTATNLFIMFNEMFSNAIKAISYVQDRQKRCLTIKLSRNDNSLAIMIRNSTEKNNEEYQKGLGFGNHLIIDNYINLFQIKDFSTVYDDENHIYEVTFSIPVTK
ncbi:MAG: GHKL domain-containing protein [Lentisphaeria bacterium]|nr:GHKL domain-containing protein [Lentisphaeria bacterium]